MKRGLSYIDWSISVGLFIIYIISIFVILGPAFQYDYSAEYLGGIVKEGLEENYHITINRIPFFIVITQPLTDDYPPEQEFEITLDDLPDEFQDMESNKQFAMVDKTGTLIIHREYYSNTQTIRFITTPGRLGLYESNVVGGGHIYYTNKEFFRFFELTSSEPFNYEHAITYGVTEKLNGLNNGDPGEGVLNYVEEIEAMEYEELKELFKYPKERDFSIQIFDGPLNGDPVLDYIKKEPTDRDEVKTLIWSDWVISSNTQRTPVMVVVRTW